MHDDEALATLAHKAGSLEAGAHQHAGELCGDAALPRRSLFSLRHWELAVNELSVNLGQLQSGLVKAHLENVGCALIIIGAPSVIALTLRLWSDCQSEAGA